MVGRSESPWRPGGVQRHRRIARLASSPAPRREGRTSCVQIRRRARRPSARPVHAPARPPRFPWLAAPLLYTACTRRRGGGLFLVAPRVARSSARPCAVVVVLRLEELRVVGLLGLQGGDGGICLRELVLQVGLHKGDARLIVCDLLVVVRSEERRVGKE